MTRTCEHDHHAIAGLVLGSLDDHEMRLLVRQIEECAACHAEYRELAGLPSILERARVSVPPIPSELRDRVVTTAVRHRAKRMWQLRTAIAAVGFLVVGASLATYVASTQPTHPVSIPLSAAEPFEGSGTVSFSIDGQAIVVAVALEDLKILPYPATYEAWLYTTEGRVVSIGQLEVGDGRVESTMTIAGVLSDFTTFWITAEPDGRDPAHAGPTVMRAPVPRW